MMNRISIKGCLPLAAAILGLAAPAASAAIGPVTSTFKQGDGKQEGNPSVLPVNSNAFGRSYGEWSAQFWEWEFSLPVSGHPLFDTADCSAGQSGKVWFLGGTFSTTPGPSGVTIGKAERTCAVPPGTALFFPIVNAECSAIEGDHADFGTSSSELRRCAQYFANLINPATLKASLDGTSITRLHQYRIQSPLFSFGPLPANNIFQSFGLTAPAGMTSHAVSDGIHLLLHPLSAGNHTLRFYGEIDFNDGSKFIQDITYHLTVRR